MTDFANLEQSALLFQLEAQNETRYLEGKLALNKVSLLKPQF